LFTWFLTCDGCLMAVDGWWETGDISNLVSFNSLWKVGRKNWAQNCHSWHEKQIKFYFGHPPGFRACLPHFDLQDNFNHFFSPTELFGPFTTLLCYDLLHIGESWCQKMFS
jgi:hypothetical protein